MNPRGKSGGSSWSVKLFPVHWNDRHWQNDLFVSVLIKESVYTYTYIHTYIYIAMKYHINISLWRCNIYCCLLRLISGFVKDFWVEKLSWLPNKYFHYVQSSVRITPSRQIQLSKHQVYFFWWLNVTKFISPLVCICIHIQYKAHVSKCPIFKYKPVQFLFLEDF